MASTRRQLLAGLALLAGAGAAPGLLWPALAGAAALPVPPSARRLTTARPELGGTVTRIVVVKKVRQLRLMDGTRILKEYRVALGRNPVGHKLRQGDRRTPEGHYHIAYRKPDSAFHLSLAISYPSVADVAAAQARGDDPGGLIMIHGQPNPEPGRPFPRRFGDWTDGCIAVQNHEMEEIWALVPDFTPVEIRA